MMTLHVLFAIYIYFMIGYTLDLLYFIFCGYAKGEKVTVLVKYDVQRHGATPTHGISYFTESLCYMAILFLLDVTLMGSGIKPKKGH